MPLMVNILGANRYIADEHIQDMDELNRELKDFVFREALINQHPELADTPLSTLRTLFPDKYEQLVYHGELTTQPGYGGKIGRKVEISNIMFVEKVQVTRG